MERLCDSHSRIKDRYEVVIIGSGYGGSIAASRLARAYRNVCVLEKGEEYQPGEFPATFPQMRKQTQIHSPFGRFGSESGLYEFFMNDDVNVVAGCGLGGGSLINANVCLLPPASVFESDKWPQEFRNDLHLFFDQDVARARAMLKPTIYPDSFPTLRKLEALQKAASQISEACYKVPLNVSFSDRVNEAGIPQKACSLCGNCVAGCNSRAKNTLDVNYLPDARNHGASIFTRIKVHRIEKNDRHWYIYYDLLGYMRHRFKSPPMRMMADIVILSGGSVGSTEILLRSRKRLPVSDQTGKGFSANGDYIAFSYNCNDRIAAIGESGKSAGLSPVGPCITGIIDMRNGELEHQMLIEDGTIHKPLATHIVAAGFMLAPKLGGLPETFAQRVVRQLRMITSVVRGPRYGALQHTQLLMSASQDNGGGEFYLDNDMIRIRWPDIKSNMNLVRLAQKMYKISQSLGGYFIDNPFKWKSLGGALITAHPLGGCCMANTADNGTVNHKGQVFSGSTGDAVHESLYVIDGSAIPRSLGTNPLLTISAMAERSVRILAKDRGWTILYNRSAPPKPLRQTFPGIQFTERMSGHFFRLQPQKTPFDNMPWYFEGERLGLTSNTSFDYILTVVIDNIDEFYRGEKHVANMVGIVTIPTFSHEPLTITDGTFDMFVPIEGRKNFRRIYYNMHLTNKNGTRYYFAGFKSMRRAWGNNSWTDTSIMFFNLYEGDDASGKLIGTGIVRMRFLTWLRQVMTTMANNVTGFKLIYETCRFGVWFTKSLIKIYGVVGVVGYARKKLSWKPGVLP